MKRIEKSLFSDNSVATSLYVKNWDSRADLFGIIRGMKIRFNSVVKITSKKSNQYFVTTLFTNLQFLGNSSTSKEMKLTKEVEKLTYLVDLTSTQAPMVKCLVSLDKIIKVSICANCNFCGNMLKNRGKWLNMITFR